jgi:predicted dehydrogenase
MVGYQLRFLPNHIKVKEYMKKKLVGKLLLSHIRAETLVIKPEETLLIDFATHFFDLIGWYLDKERIASISGSLREDDNDNQVASTTILNYESGTHSVIETVWVPRFNWGVVNRTFEAIGDAGKISTKLSGPEIQMWRANSTRDRIFGIKSFNPKETANSFMPLSSLCYREEMKTFVDCLIKKKTMPVNAGDGLRALKIAESTLVSYKKNRVVGFNEI